MQRIAVIGAGLMGQGIATAFARGGHPVVIFDRAEVLAESAEMTHRRIADADAAEGRVTDAAVEATDRLDDALRGAAVVIEAVSEDETVKADVLARMDAAALPGVVFVTNTSSLPLARLRSHVSESRVLIAVHFFNPAEIVPGVEVASVDEAGDAAAAEIVRLLRAIGKEPSLVTPAPGFIGNRLQLALFREAALCVEEGLASPAEIDTIVRLTFGFRLPAYGPFQIADMAGLVVYRAILETLTEAYGERFAVPESLQRHLDAGETGLASGRGYLDHAADTEFIGRRNARYRSLLAAASDAAPGG